MQPGYRRARSQRILSRVLSQVLLLLEKPHHYAALLVLLSFPPSKEFSFSRHPTLTVKTEEFWFIKNDKEQNSNKNVQRLMTFYLDLELPFSQLWCTQDYSFCPSPNFWISDLSDLGMHLGHFISFEKFLLGGWWWCTNDNRTSLSLFSSHKATLDLTLSVHLSVCNAFSKHLNPISDGGGGVNGPAVWKMNCSSVSFDSCDPET